MFCFISLVLLAAYAVDLASPQAVLPLICDGYVWGVIIQKVNDDPLVYNQYVQTTDCGGPAWVQSSTEPTPPTSIRPWGIEYQCQVPGIQYYCSQVPVATCCGNLTTL